MAEDDLLVSRSVARALKRHGKTIVVHTFRAAHQALAREVPAALVVDVGLPDGSGLELAAAARVRDPFLPVLVMSGEVDAGRLAESHVLRAHYLLKPVDPKQLEIFASRVRRRATLSPAQIESMADLWKREYDLTRAERDVLLLCALGTPRGELASERDVKPSTVKKQVHLMLANTGDGSLEAAVSRLLREALER